MWMWIFIIIILWFCIGFWFFVETVIYVQSDWFAILFFSLCGPVVWIMTLYLYFFHDDLDHVYVSRRNFKDEHHWKDEGF